eukprot:TRINITY_DN29201_c0_g1_i1.p1 TRINITY_DN29201_c0_g1~~TRINITY_DN29201_c0_g1_i1.p1  ORF type:complete len:150 (+),score=7.33 TRINITY_DN29201_c0_g1_i1:98-547(+)
MAQAERVRIMARPRRYAISCIPALRLLSFAVSLLLASSPFVQPERAAFAAAAGAPGSAIPLSPDGHSLITSSPLTVELYLDLACTDCARAYPAIKKAMEVYGPHASFVVRLLPLPYHRAAFDLARAAHVGQTLAAQYPPLVCHVQHQAL